MEKILIEKPIDNKIFPLLPGVYIFRDRDENVLYIGKARILRNRLSSYLSAGASPPARTSIMLSHAVSVEFIVTNTEKEALILEASLIKQHRPKYNIMLRDDKSYPFLKLNKNHSFPRLNITRKKIRDGSIYFGPYPSAGAVRETIRFISSIFPLRSCSDNVMKNRQRPCLKHQIKRCCAPCTDQITREDYKEMVRQVEMFLRGRTGALTDILKNKMKEAADNMEFEKAALVRDQLKAVNRILEKQVVVTSSDINRDILGLAMEGSTGMIAIIKVREGLVSGSETFRLENIFDENREEIFSHFIKLHYNDNLPEAPTEDVPAVILIPDLPEDKTTLEDALSSIAGRVIKIMKTDRGDMKNLSNMAARNAETALEALIDQVDTWKEKAKLALKTLKLEKQPNIIEGVDISNTGGEQSIGSLVVFKNGRPLKKEYRIFNIKGVSGPDDYASIYEVVARRIKHWKEEETPDLLLIDGGKGQLSMAKKALDILNPSPRPELLSIAKDSDGKGEKVYRENDIKPLKLPVHCQALRLLQHVRDEAHRFGVASHRKKRSRETIRSELSLIPGVGKARQRALLSHFGSVARIRSASIEELKMVKGVPSTIANNIYVYFQTR